MTSKCSGKFTCVSGTPNSHYGELGRREEALEVAVRAVEIYEKLSQKNPDAFEPDLAMSLGAMGAIYLADDNAAQAEACFMRGVQVLSRLFQKTPGAFAGLIANLSKDYLKSCEQAGKEPDVALLTPIAEQLQALNQD
jgi:tetratricopeptide (TPR) repeat protein